MRFDLFVILTTLGSFIWNIILVYLGAAAGASWEKIVEGTDVYKTITVIVLGVIALAVLIWYILYRKKNSTTNNDSKTKFINIVI